MKNRHWRRTDTFFFGSMLGLLLVTLLVIVFDNNWFQNTPFKDSWISFTWIVIMSIVILPTRFFPKTKWAKWWNGCHGDKIK